MSSFGRILLAGMLCAPFAAHANCAREVQDATPKVKQIKDDKARQRAEDYLQRAARELQENDEFECQSAVDAANKLANSKKDN